MFLPPGSDRLQSRPYSHTLGLLCFSVVSPPSDPRLSSVGRVGVMCVTEVSVEVGMREEKLFGFEWICSSLGSFSAKAARSRLLGFWGGERHELLYSS